MNVNFKPTDPTTNVVLDQRGTDDVENQNAAVKSSSALQTKIATASAVTLAAAATALNTASLFTNNANFENPVSLDLNAEPIIEKLGPFNMNNLFDEEDAAFDTINNTCAKVCNYVIDGSLFNDIADGMHSVYNSLPTFKEVQDSIPHNRDDVSDAANKVFDSMGQTLDKWNDSKYVAGGIGIAVGSVPLVWGINRTFSGVRDMIPVQFEKNTIKFETHFEEGLHKITSGLISTTLGGLTVLGGASIINGENITRDTGYIETFGRNLAELPNAAIDYCGDALVGAGLWGGAAYAVYSMKGEKSVTNLLLKGAAAVSMAALGTLQIHAWLK